MSCEWHVIQTIGIHTSSVSIPSGVALHHLVAAQSHQEVIDVTRKAVAVATMCKDWTMYQTYANSHLT